MAHYPKIETLSNNAVDIINAVKNSSTQNYKNYVPYATPDSDSLKAIGSVLMDSPSLLNEFLDTLTNRIAMRVVTSKMYENPYAFFKKGILDFGETVEENFITLIKPHKYDPYVAEKELFKAEVPDVRTAFHIENYQKFYKVTINYDLLTHAFTGWGPMNTFINDIFGQMYTSANYDEFITMKYMIQKCIVNGMMVPYKKTVSTTNEMAKAFRSLSDNMTFMKPNYNLAGVRTTTAKTDQYLFVDTDSLADLDVDELAVAFNLSKVEFMGHIVAIDSFYETDEERLTELLGTETWYEPLTEDELTALQDVKAIMVDSNWFQIYDNLIRRGDVENIDGLYWNYDLHVWKTFSFSPFSNAVVLSDAEAAITSVTVTPESATLPVGGSLQLTASVVATGFADRSVTWKSSSDDIEVSPRGMVRVVKKTPDAGPITITATSVFDPSKSDTCAITIS